MTNHFRPAVLAAFILLAAPGLGLAQPAPATSSAPAEGRDQLAARLLHEIYSARGGSLGDWIKQTSGGLGGKSSSFEDVPQWNGLIETAMEEELAAQATRLELVYGRELFKDFTDGELRAGLVLLADPVGRAYVAASGTKGGPNPLQAGAAELMARTPDGAAFLTRFRRWSIKSSDALDRQALVIIFPGALIRFADKIDKLEASAASPLTDRQKLGVEIATVLVDKAGVTELFFDTKIAKARLTDPMFPRSWAALSAQAMDEEWKADLPMMEDAIGRWLAEQFTTEELTAGLAFFKGMSQSTLHSFFKARSQGGKKPEMTEQDTAAVQELARAPGGMSFIQKLAHLDKLDADGIGVTFARRFMPGFLRRFGQKIRASEAATPAAA